MSDVTSYLDTLRQAGDGICRACCIEDRHDPLHTMWDQLVAVAEAVEQAHRRDRHWAAQEALDALRAAVEAQALS